MKFIKLLGFSLLLLSLCNTGFAQQEAMAGPLVTAKAKKYVEEVYKGHPEYYTPEKVAYYSTVLARIEVKSIARAANEAFTPLSAIPLVGKYNNAIERDTEQNFNAADFNPFKYFLNFHPGEQIGYRVDNTDYVILISPKK